MRDTQLKSIKSSNAVSEIASVRPQRLAALLFCVAFGLAQIGMGGQSVNGQLIVAHRGASYDAPENTLAAFRLAFEQDADGVEGDFYLTSDNRIVCIHDSDTERVANRKLIVAKSTLAELKELDVGSWKDKKWHAERIPTIEEVFEVIPKGKKLFIELKTGPEIVKPLLAALEKSTLTPDQYEIICFKIETIAECEKCISGVKTHWLCGYDESKNPKDQTGWTPTAQIAIATIKNANADALGSKANRDAFNAEFIAAMNQAGLKFHVWTVDDIETARFYQQLGAYGITTNRPAFIRAGLEKPNAKKPTSNQKKPAG